MESQEPNPLTTQSGRLVKTKKDNNFVYTGTKKVENDTKVQDTLPVELTPENDTSERNENSGMMSVVPTSENNTSETNESSDTSVATANYALNLEKTLDKKIDACNRLPIEAMHSETNSVISFSTTAFDLAQKCTARYFSCDSYTIKHSHKQDKRGLIEGDVMRISNKCNAFTITINFYRTTSKALINGAGLKTFQETHLPAIEEMIKMDYNQSEEQSVKYKVLGAKEELANLKTPNGGPQKSEAHLVSDQDPVSARTPDKTNTLCELAVAPAPAPPSCETTAQAHEARPTGTLKNDTRDQGQSPSKSEPLTRPSSVNLTFYCTTQIYILLLPCEF